MKGICFSFLFILVSNQAVSQDGNYTSITFKKSVWSGSSYVGDLSDWVHFHDGNATVVEYRAPESSFSFSAAIREAEDGSNELESLVGATEIGGAYLKIETGGADGQIYNDDPFEPVLMPETQKFTTQLDIVALGTQWKNDTGIKYGMAWVHLKQPAEIDLTYYSIFPDSGGGSFAPSFAHSAIDPEFSTHIIGAWADVDSLNSFMKGQSTIYSSPTISGNFIRGLALDVEIVAGLYFSNPGADLETAIKEKYGLDYEYVDSSGLAWTVSYKLAYNLVYRSQEKLAFGIQIGLEGRALQTLFEIPEDKTVARRDQVIGKIGIGDNDSYQWGPYLRLAMVY